MKSLPAPAGGIHSRAVEGQGHVSDLRLRMDRPLPTSCRVSEMQLLGYPLVA